MIKDCCEEILALSAELLQLREEIVRGMSSPMKGPREKPEDRWL